MGVTVTYQKDKKWRNLFKFATFAQIYNFLTIWYPQPGYHITKGTHNLSTLLSAILSSI